MTLREILKKCNILKIISPLKWSVHGKLSKALTAVDI